MRVVGRADDDGIQAATRNGNGHLSMLEAQVVAAAQVGFVHARRIASNRVVSKAKRDTDAKAALAAQEGAHAPFVLGPDWTHRLTGATPLALVTGAHDSLAAPLLSWGLTTDQVDLIVTAIEQHAASTLYEPQPRTFPPRVRSYIVNVVRGRARVPARA